MDWSWVGGWAKGGTQKTLESWTHIPAISKMKEKMQAEASGSTFPFDLGKVNREKGCFPFSRDLLFPAIIWASPYIFPQNF